MQAKLVAVTAVAGLCAITMSKCWHSKCTGVAAWSFLQSANAHRCRTLHV